MFRGGSLLDSGGAAGTANWLGPGEGFPAAAQGDVPREQLAPPDLTRATAPSLFRDSLSIEQRFPLDQTFVLEERGFTRQIKAQ